MSNNLTELQKQVLAAIAAGATRSAAASSARVDPQTIFDWLGSPDFRDALRQACSQKALVFRRHAEARVPHALDVLYSILDDPSAPVRDRAKAAKALILYTRRSGRNLPVVEREIVHKNAQPTRYGTCTPRQNQPPGLVLILQPWGGDGFVCSEQSGSCNLLKL